MNIHIIHKKIMSRAVLTVLWSTKQFAGLLIISCSRVIDVHIPGVRMYFKEAC